MKLRAIIGLIVIALLAVGCGTIQGNIQTTIHTSGEVIQDFNLSLTGGVASIVQQNLQNPDFQAGIEQAKKAGCLSRVQSEC